MSNVRLVSKGGVYTLRYVKLDDDGYVDKVLEEVTFKSKDHLALVGMLENALYGCDLPIIVMNSGNSKLLRED